ncbi:MULTISPECIES: hypothetical protein [unclassified Peribacillus]|uniref:hypothetical protein n=1 Tax=unclassified Peribacillus TaxID=2675266 RepID=UPI00366D6716
MPKFIETFEFLSKILGPAFFAFVILFGILGYGISDLYKFNITHKITHSFPSQFIIQFYFYSMIFGIIFIIGIITLQTKISASTVDLQGNSKLDPNKSAAPGA